MPTACLLFDVVEPPEPFSEEFPMVALFALVPVGDDIVMYVPEDDQIISDPVEVLKYLYHLAPITRFRGAGQANIEEAS